MSSAQEKMALGDVYSDFENPHCVGPLFVMLFKWCQLGQPALG